jgi:hypothetical protein
MTEFLWFALIQIVVIGIFVIVARRWNKRHESELSEASAAATSQVDQIREQNDDLLAKLQVVTGDNVRLQQERDADAAAAEARCSVLQSRLGAEHDDVISLTEKCFEWSAKVDKLEFAEEQRQIMIKENADLKRRLTKRSSVKKKKR